MVQPPYHPSEFDEWVNRSILVAYLRFKLDFLTKFDLGKVGSCIVGYCRVFSGG